MLQGQIFAAPSTPSVARTPRNSRVQSTRANSVRLRRKSALQSGSAESQRYSRLRTVRGDVPPKGFGGDRKAPETGRAPILRPTQSSERETPAVVCYVWKETKSVLAARSQAALCGRRTRGGPLLQGLPSLKTVHRTVFKFTPLGAPSGRGVSPSADGDEGAARHQRHRL